MARTSSRGGEREALFVRIPTTEAQRLGRAAFELNVSKQDLIAGLVARYVDPASPSSLDALRRLGDPAAEPSAPTAAGAPAAATPRRVTVELGGEPLTVGHHDFWPAPEAEVLTLADAAELLQVDQAVVARLARDGELPGRDLAGEWRFARRALLDWLAAGGEREAPARSN